MFALKLAIFLDFKTRGRVLAVLDGNVAGNAGHAACGAGGAFENDLNSILLLGHVPALLVKSATAPERYRAKNRVL